MTEVAGRTLMKSIIDRGARRIHSDPPELCPQRKEDICDENYSSKEIQST